MLLARLVAASAAVAATPARTAKRDHLAAVLADLAPDEIEPAVGFLTGDPRQGRIGVGWATLAAVAGRRAVTPAGAEPLTVGDLDRLLERLATTTGAGSMVARGGLLDDFFDRATDVETDFVRRLIGGELRQGALEGVMADAVATAAQVPATAVRRAAMLGGDLRRAAMAALTGGRDGLDRIGLQVLHPVQPMLASTSADVVAALLDSAPTPAGGPGGLVSIEWKLDGARVQVHRLGDEVRIFTRNLNDVTAHLPGVVAMARRLPVDGVVLDGEVLSMLDDGRPHAFQDTMSQFGRGAGSALDDTAGSALDGVPDLAPAAGDDRADRAAVLRAWFFDVLHTDGRDLIDEPLGDRLVELERVAGPHRIPGLVTADADEAEIFAERALAAGHEGVMVKRLDSTYQAGRRGKAWRKVKPVRLFDLVVLAVEWGSGRRQGWLSNLHLGARDPATGGFVMVGKTFKGMTDEMLRWQTAEFLARETSREGHVVQVRPELVVEIALDGVQASTRYPGGVALRFARVKRYRPDKDAATADVIGSLRALLPG